MGASKFPNDQNSKLVDENGLPIDATNPLEVTGTVNIGTMPAVSATITNAEVEVKNDSGNPIPIKTPTGTALDVQGTVSIGQGATQNHVELVDENGTPITSLNPLDVTGTVLISQIDNANHVEIVNANSVPISSSNPFPTQIIGSVSVTNSGIQSVEINQGAGKNHVEIVDANGNPNSSSNPLHTISQISGTVSVGSMPTVTVNDVGIKVSANTVKIDQATNDANHVEIVNTGGQPNSSSYPLYTEITGTPSVQVSGTPTFQISQQAGHNHIEIIDKDGNANTSSNPLYTTAKVTEMPNVTIASMPNVTIASMPSVTINGTPTVEIQNNVGNAISITNESVGGTTIPLGVTGSVYASITGTPTVEVQNSSGSAISIKNESISGTTVPLAITGSVNASIVGTPNVSATISGTPTVKISASDNNVKIDQSGNHVEIVNSGGQPNSSSYPLYTETVGVTNVNIIGTPGFQISQLAGANHVEIVDALGNPNNASYPLYTQTTIAPNQQIQVANQSGLISNTNALATSIIGTPTVNATITSLPNVTVSSMPTTNIKTTGTDTVAVNGSVSVSNTSATPLYIDNPVGDSLSVNSTLVASTITLPVNVTKSSSIKTANGSVDFSTSSTTLIAPVVAKKLRIYSINIDYMVSTTSIILYFRYLVSGTPTTFASMRIINGVADAKTLNFSNDGYLTPEGASIIAVTAANTTGNTQFNVVYEEV